MQGLVHPSNELIEVILAISSIPSLNIMVPLLFHTTQRCLQLEWPQKVVGLLEVGPNSHDLMDEIFNADYTILAQALYYNSKSCQKMRQVLKTYSILLYIIKQIKHWEPTCSITELSVKAILCLFSFP